LLTIDPAVDLAWLVVDLAWLAGLTGWSSSDPSGNDV
jgi:hypothetical protein